MSKPEFKTASEDDFHGIRISDRIGFGDLSFTATLGLSPLSAYLGLKSLFGDPNRKCIDVDKMQWKYWLKCEDFVFEVYDWKLESWSIVVYDRRESKNADRAEHLMYELESQVAASAKKQRAIVTSLLKAPYGYVVENPYFIYYKTARELIELARKLTTDLSAPFDAKDKTADICAPSSLCRAAFFQLIAAVEGLLNLIYELYLAPDLRDDRIVNRLLREQIDVKIRLAPVYCVCFENIPISHSSDAFKAFLRLVNTRNDLVHANVTKHTKTATVNHDGFLFLVKEEPSADAIVPTSVVEWELDHIDPVLTVINNMVNELVGRMKDDYRNDFCAALSQQYIDVEYKNGIPIIYRPPSRDFHEMFKRSTLGLYRHIQSLLKKNA